MSRNDLPEPWRTALERKGIDSIRGLAAKAGISPMAASRLVKGEGTSVETVNAVAWFVFGDDVELVWKLRGASVRDLGQFELPAEASLLTDDQRAAVVAVVRAMLAPDIKAALGGRPKQDLSELSQRDRDQFEAQGLREAQSVMRNRHKATPHEDPEAEAQG